MIKPKNKLISCIQCGNELVCGAVNGEASCWCDSLPHIMPLNGKTGSCYCQKCLEKEIEKQQALVSKNNSINSCVKKHYTKKVRSQ